MKYYYRYNICPQCHRGDRDLIGVIEEPLPFLFNTVVPSSWSEAEVIRTNEQLLKFLRETGGKVIDELGRMYNMKQFGILIRESFDFCAEDWEAQASEKFQSLFVEQVGTVQVAFVDFHNEGFGGETADGWYVDDTAERERDEHRRNETD